MSILIQKVTEILQRSGLIRSGTSGSTGAMMRTDLQPLEERETTVSALQAALIEGEESGISDRTPNDIIDAVIERRRGDGTPDRRGR